MPSNYKKPRHYISPEKLEVIFELYKECAARSQGVSCSQMKELDGVCRAAVSSRIYALVEAGMLVCMPYGRKTAYFLDQESADRRSRELKSAAFEGRKKQIIENNAKARNRSPRPSVAGKNFFHMSAEVQAMEAHIPQHVKVISAAPLRDYRYYVDDSPMLGGFLTEWQDLRRHA